MRNEDGTRGPHWSMEQVKQLREQKKELQEFNLPDVFAVMNMMYSDYCEVAKKFNVNTIWLWRRRGSTTRTPLQTGRRR